MTTEVTKNKGGRPKGAKNASTILQEAILQESSEIIMKEFPKIVKAVVKKAADGDLKAAKLIMDRVIPARKAIEHNQAKGSTGVTIVVQGTAQIENGRPVIEHKAADNLIEYGEDNAEEKELSERESGRGCEGESTEESQSSPEPSKT